MAYRREEWFGVVDEGDEAWCCGESRRRCDDVIDEIGGAGSVPETETELHEQKRSAGLLSGMIEARTISSFELSRISGS